MAMDSIGTAMEDIKLHVSTEMNATKAELRQKVAHLVDEIISNKLATIAEHLRAREELLDNKLQEVESSQEALERKSFSTNLVMFGLLESSREDCPSQVKFLIGSEGIVDVTRKVCC
jgi:hypothetical protein